MRALDPAHRLGAEGLADGDVVAVDGLEMRVVAHARAHRRLAVVPARRPTRAVLTGDTVLGRGTTVVAHPDGRLGAYLTRCERLRALAEAHEARRDLAGPRPGASTTRSARSTTTSPTGAERLEQVREALRARRVGRGRRPPTTCCRAGSSRSVYADVDPVLVAAAAELSPCAPSSTTCADA